MAFGCANRQIVVNSILDGSARVLIRSFQRIVYFDGGRNSLISEDGVPSKADSKPVSVVDASLEGCEEE